MKCNLCGRELEPSAFANHYGLCAPRPHQTNTQQRFGATAGRTTVGIVCAIAMTGALIWLAHVFVFKGTAGNPTENRDSAAAAEVKGGSVAASTPDSKLPAAVPTPPDSAHDRSSRATAKSVSHSAGDGLAPSPEGRQLGAGYGYDVLIPIHVEKLITELNPEEMSLARDLCEKVLYEYFSHEKIWLNQTYYYLPTSEDLWADPSKEVKLRRPITLTGVCGMGLSYDREAIKRALKNRLAELEVSRGGITIHVTGSLVVINPSACGGSMGMESDSLTIVPYKVEVY